MPRVLTVDDSRAIRALVSRELSAVGCEVDEAEDGLQGLAKLDELVYDLIILDVTMPNLDGPGMLGKLREAGKQTPVLMLTSEAKRSVLVEVMRLKIDDYILKPFKVEELRAKALRALRLPDVNPVEALKRAAEGQSPFAEVPASPVGAAGATRETPARETAAPAPAPAARQFGDILVIDDIENVAKRLRAVVPQHLSLFSSTNGQSGLTHCRERAFRVVLIDRELPDVNSVTLMRQVRVLQPSAACLALTLRGSTDVRKDVKEDGFDDVVYKPFSPEVMDEFLAQYFDASEPISVDCPVITVPGYTGREDRVERYYQRISSALKDGVGRVAEACFEQIIFDASKLPDQDTRNAQLIQGLQELADRVGLGLYIVGSLSLTKTLKSFTETASLPFFATVDEARKLTA